MVTGIASEQSVDNRSCKTQLDPAKKLRYGGKICGRVVRYDTAKACITPINGVIVGMNWVQASFLGFFPREVRWSWFFS